MRSTLRSATGLTAVLALLLAPGPGDAQEGVPVDPPTREMGGEEAAVLAAAQALLDVIGARDSTAARQLLLPEGSLMAVVPAEGGARVQVTPHERFIRTIGEPGPAFLERMWEPEVRIRGPIATVWAPYEFHVDGVFSHCGIDAFSLIKTDGEWKVAGVVYTVEREDCSEERPER